MGGGMGHGAESRGVFGGMRNRCDTPRTGRRVVKVWLAPRAPVRRGLWTNSVDSYVEGYRYGLWAEQLNETHLQSP